MIKKPLSCKLKSSKVSSDLDCLLINKIDGYKNVITELIFNIHEELSDDWNEIWSFDDVIERFDKGEILWLVLKDDKPISCSWISIKTKKNLFIYNTWLKPKLRGTGLFEEISLIRNDKLYSLGYKKLLCTTDNVQAEKALKKIGYVDDNWLNIHYTFWTGGYDSTFLIYKFLLEDKTVQPIYIDDRVNHGGYHSNSLVKQRGGDTYPRKSTEIELERMDWLREKIYEVIPDSKKLLLETMVIDKPIKEDEEISSVVKKYNEWIPDTVVSKGWLPVYTDLVARFQKQFGLEIFWANDHIEGEFYEVFDDSIEDGIMNVDKLPSKYKDLKIFSGLNQPLRTTNKKEMLEEAEQFGFDELLYYTWTCWYPINDEPCGKCHVCKERIIECLSI
jgi:7-cyano-7-deazaguanine synthase